jgi:hypothetical protein
MSRSSALIRISNNCLYAVGQVDVNYITPAGLHNLYFCTVPTTLVIAWLNSMYKTLDFRCDHTDKYHLIFAYSDMVIKIRSVSQ